MSRLTHTRSGFRRQMQVSVTPLFVFVEGRDSDPFFYDGVCRSVCSPAQVAYRIVRGDELGSGGGKMVLLQFFDYLRTVNNTLERRDATR